MANRSSVSTARQAAGGLLEGGLVLAIAAALVIGIAVASGSAPGAAGTALAARGGSGGHGSGGQSTATGGCVVDTTSVSGFGLPTDEVINFFVTDATGKAGWVLGFSGDGTWSEPVQVASGATTYEFASRTWGPNGTRYTVFASCSTG